MVKIDSQSPKTEFGFQEQYDREFHMEHEKIYFWGSIKQKIDPKGSKTEFWAQNQYGRVIYPSIGNLKWNKK
jgi:hypothetical protein